MKMKLVKLTAHYKMGHQSFTSPLAILPMHIVSISRVPEEVPEFLDGCSTILTTVTDRTYLIDKFDDVIEKVEEAIKEE